MNKLTNLNNNKQCALLSIRLSRTIILPLLLVVSTLFTGCDNNFSSAKIAAEPSTDTRSQAVSLEANIEKVVIGVIKVKGGAILERDIIPQLCEVFKLSNEEVKDKLSEAISSKLINQSLTDFRRMEGMIIPGEYDITKDSTLEELICHWVSQSEKRYNEIFATSTNHNNLEPNRQLALASMVEAECLASAHHEKVATVFLNRLEDGSKLQSCVTAEYALGYQRPYLTSDDISKTSDYNTYQVQGLPVGPICAISDVSLKASIRKKLDTGIYFFYYDYVLNDMFFYEDYKKFMNEGTQSRKRFEANSTVDKRAKINKQALYH